MGSIFMALENILKFYLYVILNQNILVIHIPKIIIRNNFKIFIQTFECRFIKVCFR
jgi:hypothetical protein